MSQPEPTFTAATLTPGQTYRVKAPFIDYDGDLHPLGETWRFVEHNFLPYEDGLTLSILQNGLPWTIRLQWREEAQGPIIDHFADFVEALPDDPAGQAPGEAGKTRKVSFWRHITIGAVILFAVICLVIVGLFFIMEYQMGYRAGKASDRQAPDITLAVAATHP